MNIICSDVLPIHSAIQVPTSSFQAKALMAIDGADYQGVLRLATKDLTERGVVVTEEYCLGALRALKQYYALSVFDPDNLHAITEQIDPFWHAHVLHTACYAMLCKQIGGFMHHDPLDHDDLEKTNAAHDVYMYTYSVLVKLFGVEGLDAFFYPSQPTKKQVVCLHDIDRDLSIEFGQILRSDPDNQRVKARYGFKALQIAS